MNPSPKTRHDRIVDRLLAPLDRGVDNVVTPHLNPRTSACLYRHAASKGYTVSKVGDPVVTQKKILACVCGTPYASSDVDMDAQTVTPHCVNISCTEYGYMSNSVATISIRDADRRDAL